MKTMLDALPEDTRTPYQRFEDLAKSVFAVPKTEIDKRIAEYERQKTKRKKKKARSKTG